MSYDTASGSKGLSTQKNLTFQLLVIVSYDTASGSKGLSTWIILIINSMSGCYDTASGSKGLSTKTACRIPSRTHLVTIPQAVVRDCRLS